MPFFFINELSSLINPESEKMHLTAAYFPAISQSNSTDTISLHCISKFLEVDRNHNFANKFARTLTKKLKSGFSMFPGNWFEFNIICNDL